MALTCRTLLFSNGSIHKRVACFLLNRKTKKSLSRNKAERMCCIYPGTVLEIKNEINKIFSKETHIFFKSDKMRKVFKESNLCKLQKKKKNIKNIVKTKIYAVNSVVGSSHIHPAQVIQPRCTDFFYKPSLLLLPPVVKIGND